MPQILIVEDEHIVAKDLTHRLQVLGYKVSGHASSGQTELMLIKNENGMA